RNPTPIWVAARPARPGASTVSNRSWTRFSVCWSNLVTGAVGVTRTGSPKRTMVRIVMFFRLTAHGDCGGGAGERSPSRGEPGAQGLVQDHLDVVQGGSAACQGTFVEGGTVRSEERRVGKERDSG